MLQSSSHLSEIELTEDGSTPATPLFEMSSHVSFASTFTFTGTEPVNWLLLRSSCVNAVHDAMVDGMLPESVFEARLKNLCTHATKQQQ